MLQLITNRLAILAIAFVLMSCNRKNDFANNAGTVDNGSTDTTAADTQAPPATWQEHWFEHSQLLSRVFYDTTVCVYYDDDVNRTITWPNVFLADVWNYTKKVYGNFSKLGGDNRLYVVLHQDKYSGGHPATFFDESHDYRNVIDCGSTTPNAWNNFDYGTVAIPVHEVGHIVEGASKGIHNSPAFPVWGDSKWMEIYIYDVYKGLEMPSYADKWYAEMMEKTDNFPVAGTHWFKNWFYPIYANYGGATVLNRFFETLATHFPTHTLPDGYKEYTRDMNLGEFIHFWSGAAATNLKAQATLAFGWSSETDAQFKQAQLDFPDIAY